METGVLLLLGLLGGWGANLLADALPEQRPIREVWAQPWLALVPGRQVARPWRTRLVFGAAVALGWLAQIYTGEPVRAAVLAAYAWFFLAVAVIDLEHRRVLNRMLAPATAGMAAVSLLLRTPEPTSALWGALTGFAFLLLLARLRPGGIGMGDVKLVAVIGLATGLGGVIVALVVGIAAGGVAALGLLFWTRFDRRATMAYAPYLVIGAWIALFWGQELWAWYAGYLTQLAA